MFIFDKPLIMSAKNPTLELAVMIYLPKSHLELFVAELFISKYKKTELGRKVFREYYNKMSPHDKRMLEETYKKMTPEQKKNPHIDEL